MGLGVCKRRHACPVSRFLQLSLTARGIIGDPFAPPCHPVPAHAHTGTYHMRSPTLSSIALIISAFGAALAILALSGIVGLILHGAATTDYFLEITAAVLAVAFVVSLALPMTWALSGSHRGAAVLDLAFLFLGLGGIASFLDIPAYPLAQLDADYAQLVSRSTVTLKAVAQFPAGDICRTPTPPAICELYITAFALMTREAPIAELDSFIADLETELGIHGEDIKLDEYLEKRHDLPVLAKILLTQFYTYTAYREKLEHIVLRQQKLHAVKQFLADFEWLFKPMAITIAVLFAGLSSGRAISESAQHQPGQ